MSQSVQVVERPILFSGEMVRAILEGRKTQTRRVANLSHAYHDTVIQKPNGLFYAYREGVECHNHRSPAGDIVCPYGNPGDRLWVRETFNTDWADHQILYKADGGSAIEAGYTREPIWKPSIHMPRWASRLTLEIVKVRVERLQEISKADCIAEGMEGLEDVHAGWHQSYAQLWDSINSKRGFGWDKNPWVWAITFQRVRS